MEYDDSYNPTEEVIATAIDFMRALNNLYGPENGTKLFNDILDLVPEEISGGVIQDLLTGNRGVTIKMLRLLEPRTKKVTAIKAIRAITNCGLKEAKDISDQLEAGIMQCITISKFFEPQELAPTFRRRDAINLLREASIVVR